nr:MAG TPA: hypothetical protein [Bacteriophage sp.]
MQSKKQRRVLGIWRHRVSLEPFNYHLSIFGLLCMMSLPTSGGSSCIVNGGHHVRNANR